MNRYVELIASLPQRHFQKCLLIVYTLFFFITPFNTHALSIIVLTNDSIDTNNRMVIRNYLEKAVVAHSKRSKKLLAEFWSASVPDTSRNGRDKWLCGFNMPPKRTYWDSTLRNAFKKDKYIKLSPKETSIVLHPQIKWIYGVTLHLEIKGKQYSDEGYMFMVWDFRNPETPQIHIRTWQSAYIDKEKGVKIKLDDVFTLADFDL